jgi:hypothetical protein
MKAGRVCGGSDLAGRIGLGLCQALADSDTSPAADCDGYRHPHRDADRDPHQGPDAHTDTATITATPTPTACSVKGSVTRTPGLRMVQIPSAELAQSFPRKLTQSELSLKSVSMSIHPAGIDLAVQVGLEDGKVLTATGTMLPRAENDVVVLVPGEMHVEGAPDALAGALATAALKVMLQDPQFSRIALSSGRVLCVELQEGSLLIAELAYTPTPTNTPIPPKELATMFPANPVHGLRSLAQAGAAIEPMPTYDFETKALLGLDGRISFPPGSSGSVADLLLRFLDPVLTQGMVQRRSGVGAGREEYCNCIKGLKLGDLVADVCWSAGREEGNALRGEIYTRLSVIRPRVAAQFAEIEADYNRLRP